MPLMPERVKYRKMHRGNRAGLATRGQTVAFGEYGLMALQRCWLDTKQIEAARLMAETLRAADLRVTVDAGAGKLGAKIRNAQLEKIPYMLILGPKEAEAGTISVRSRTGGDQGALSVAAFVQQVKTEAVPRPEP